MKTINIFAIGSHTLVDRISGVDFVRILQPMKYLDGYTDNKVKIDVHVYDPAKGKSFDWRDIFKKYDIVYFNYSTNDVGYAVMGTLAQKYKKKLICDIDDAIWLIRKDNSAYDIFKEGSWGRDVVTSILDDVDYVTCTNEYLKNVILTNTKKTADRVYVFPNYIDLSVYKHKAKKRNSHIINIGHFGSSTHFQNIVSPEFIKALTRIFKEYPNVMFTTIGSFFGVLKMKWGSRYNVQYGDPDVIKWITEKLPPLSDEIDFFVTPLQDNTYTRSKSATKYNEIASTGRPGIFQNVRQYREVVKDGVDGYLCIHEHEWYKAMKNLIDDKKLREQMGNNAYKKVKENYTIQRHIKEYADFMKIVIDSK